MSKHTKGPWKIEQYENGDTFIFGRANGLPNSLVAKLISTTLDTHADANLIAAAPELLETLKNLSYALTNQNSEGNLNLNKSVNQGLRDALDIIAKATGGAE